MPDVLDSDPLLHHLSGANRRLSERSYLTQSFFEQLLAKRNLLWEARRTNGRLRTLLSLAVKRFVTDEVRRRTSIKRGGQVSIVSFESDETFLNSAVDSNRPDEEFDRQWARALLEKAYNELYNEYRLRGKGEFFIEVSQFVSWNSRTVPQLDVAQRSGISVGALRMSIARMRKRYQELLRKEIAQTVGSESDTDEELHLLATYFQSSPLPTIHPPATTT